ncbi:MAG TPA: HAMP domain-containing sensor histidine kinase, partial [Chroococcidiopsis sp.]
NPTPGRSNDFSNPLDGILSESNSVGDRRHNERKSWNALRRSKDARPVETINTAPDPDHAAHRSENTKATGDRADIELLQAIAHEVRTPLSTIRTLTRLLLKRKDLGPDVVKRLEIIDRECTEQIDRFSLIFRAVELETANGKQPLTPPSAISLTQLFQQNVPRWQQQASQRNLTLEVTVPAKLPLVLADSTMLDQMLTGLIDRITHSLPPGSHIQVRVKLAGHQLKLQFQSQPWGDDSELGNGQAQASSTLKSIGEMLILQPETGSLSLNLSVTKNLFQALGGKLIVRQRPKRGEELTIFLPLETQKSEELP